MKWRWTAQAAAYRDLAGRLTGAENRLWRDAIRPLLGVVLNVLLAWPDCCFRSEPWCIRARATPGVCPGSVQRVRDQPKERELIDICKQRRHGPQGLAYTVYTGTRDTTSRLKGLLEQEGFRVAVLRASVDASRREDWIAEQLDRGIDVLITNPELVKTGLGPAGVSDDRVHAVGLQRLQPPTGGTRPGASGRSSRCA